MFCRISPIGLALALLVSIAWAQEESAKPQEQPVPVKDGDEAGKAEQKPGDEDKGTEAPDRVVKIGGKERIKILKPKDVPGELLRLKSKADIKAEITVRTSSGRPVTFKGVIRNGKLIERIVRRRFVPQRNLDHSRCGVRVWWSGGADGYIFFRYSVIKTLAITGRLTDAERREIMRRLRAKREGRDTDSKAAAAAEEVDQQLAKFSPADLKSYLLRQYPYDKGWNHKKMRALKRKKLIDNKVLTREEEIFVKYFSILVEAHFENLKKNTRKIEIEPGSDKPEASEERSDGESDTGESVPVDNEDEPVAEEDEEEGGG